VAISSMMFATAAAAADVPVPRSPPTIRVVARATVTAKPDQAEIELGVTTDKKTAAAAVGDNQQKMEKVLAAVKKELGADGEVRTSEVSVHPRFEETRAADTLLSRPLLLRLIPGALHFRCHSGPRRLVMRARRFPC